MGGRLYCQEEDLTREILLDHLLGKRDEVFVVNTFDVKVTDLGGDAFDIKLDDKDNAVWQLKSLIEKNQGTKAHLQELYLDDSKANAQLKDDRKVRGACKMLLCVRVVSDKKTLLEAMEQGCDGDWR